MSTRHLTVRSGYVAASQFVPLSVAVVCSLISWNLAVTLDLLIPCEKMRLEIDHIKPCILLT